MRRKLLEPWSCKDELLFFKDRIYLLPLLHWRWMLYRYSIQPFLKGYKKLFNALDDSVIIKKQVFGDHQSMWYMPKEKKRTMRIGRASSTAYTQCWLDWGFNGLYYRTSKFQKQNNDYVVDRLSKMAHGVAMAPSVTANSIAQAFYATILELYGVP